MILSSDKRFEIFFYIFSMNDSIETNFTGKEFCQWIITNNYVEDDLMAQTFFKKLIDNEQIICINQKQNDEDMDLLSNWYAFSK
jgi:hypothetical protein